MRIVSLSLCVSAIALLPSVALAQTPDGGAPSLSTSTTAQAEARSEMREGLAAFENGNYETALRRFRRAMELVPEANLPHRHAARALEALARWDDAVLEHEEYLRIKPDVSDASAVRERIDEIRHTHLSGTLELRCEPEPSEIVVDGASVRLDASHQVRLPKGVHRVLVRAPNHAQRELEVVVPAESVVTPKCSLDSVPGSALLSPTTTPREPPAPQSPWYGRWYTWAGAGTLVVVGVVATVLVVGSGGNPPPATEGGNHVFP